MWFNCILAIEQTKIRGVIFDLFHTLTGLESEWSGLPWTSDVLGIERRTWDEALSARSRWRLVGDERDPYTILRTLAHEIDPTIADSRILEALNCRIQRFKSALMRIPEENIRALQRLRAEGLRLGIISNADVMEVAAWAESPLAGLFDSEIFSCVVGSVKPEPDIFYKCLDQMRLAPRECLYVGDGGSDELTGAKRVGLSTVFISGIVMELWPERVSERRALSDHHIERIPQILEILDIA
jgi:putative hydrolase of the HAD superfamily